MGVGVNARTAFSLLFPPILDEFGWERGVTAGAFSFGFLVSAMLSPSLGRLMDRRGPRVVLEMGVGLMAVGLMLATLVRQPWHLYATLGVMVGGGSVCLGYTGQALFLPNWFVRRRGLAMSLAFSGVGVGSIILLPWVQVLIAGAGWRTACWVLAILMLVLLAPLNLLLRRRPEDLGLEPDGDRAARVAPRTPGRQRGGRGLGGGGLDARPRHAHAPLLVDRGGLFLRRSSPGTRCRCTRRSTWSTIGFSASRGRLGRWASSAWPASRARSRLGHVSDRIGREWVWTVGSLGFALCYLRAAAPAPAPDAGAALRHGGHAGQRSATASPP